MEVANVVASIVSAFGNGRDLFLRMVGKKSKKRGREPTLSEQEAWLRDSLDRRPQQIRDSYHSNVARFGHRFEVGDSTAHSSLAHTLLVLNSGLINLINHVLHRESKYDPTTSKALFDLSEAAATDTIAALSQLSLRMANQSALNLRTVPSPRAKDPGDSKAKQKKRPGATPLVRGAWVRPKSSSVVSASSSKTGKSRPAHERSKSEADLPTVSKKSISKPRSRTPSPDKPENALPDKRRRRRHHRCPEEERSMLLVPPDTFLPLEQTQANVDAPPLRPPKIPLHTRPTPTRRPRPPSAATFMTTSTKIGEIPERHLVHDLPTHIGQHAPLVQYIPEEPQVSREKKPKKIRRGFKFWKKGERPIPVSAY
ncbi:uncharacterized protein HMPREF1541_07817 [Cyphellophora europaea CBS 101466]|uniref:Uncharacterized protein n=1 Tax=Cyphellophora europaea (strain CBS 101466) TaxID=1220924 RepID=W2RKH4_CYPE1|nr:uncharacterized protein HMPREF1541_07817 [Cyphellophora europaea CBS 101466]ETN36830.1 hypothetical protein HMPREF1541_07817 [Cyphellophora europaea CBS 101466]